MNEFPIEKTNDLIEHKLESLLQEIEDVVDSDVLTYIGRIQYGADDIIREGIESIENRRASLAVILETPGGYIEVVQRIADTLRHHYETVEFIIPNHAMSAGTVLVMSGDAIHMDYYSILGPIDPQLSRSDDSVPVPALGYLAQYERLIEKSRNGELTTAELTILIEKFDLAELYHYEQARELSISLLKEWLVKFKFKNWKVTETQQRKVTQKMRTDRAEEIAKTLNDTEQWHSHGRGISMRDLREILKLEIKDFREDLKLNPKLKGYYNLLTDYSRKRGQDGVVHVRNRFSPFVER